MAKPKRTGLMLGIGAVAAVLGYLLFFRKKVEAVPENTVIVSLESPPSDATVWSLVLTDWDITVPIYQVGGLATVDVAEPITFEIPDGVQFPLRIVSLTVSKWIDFYGTPALQHLYEMQSVRPYLWDWDKSDWSDEPDPSYVEVFIPESGHYYI